MTQSKIKTLGKARFSTGDRVRLTGALLRNTGQISGGEGKSRWSVLSCDCELCKLGGYIAVDQQNSTGDGQRHINTANLQRVKGIK